MTYLLINICSISIPLIFSFHKKLQFNKQWQHFWPAAIITLIPFILWDIYYTHLGVWWFNEKHLVGVNLFNLPIEEWLFFICIPYASVFTYHCLNQLITNDLLSNYTKSISFLLSVRLILIGILSLGKLYTSVTFFATSMAIIYLQWIKKAAWLSRFYFMYLIILLPFYLVNGMLTGMWLTQPVVLYSNMENLGIRINTIPVEDVFYGMLLLLMNIAIFEKLKAKQNPH